KVYVLYDESLVERKIFTVKFNFWEVMINYINLK